MSIFETILFAMWFFAPAGYANMAPILANNIASLKKYNWPMDFGKTFRGKRILGSHKTFRGLISGVIAGTAIGLFEFVIASNTTFIQELTQPVDYTSPLVIGMGAAMGFGALAGDAIKSFFKRQIGVKPGKNWVPFDQIDFIVGGLLLSLPFAELGYTTYSTIFIIAALLHPAANVTGWMLHLKDKPF